MVLGTSAPWTKADSRTGAGKVQNDPRVAYCSRKSQNVQRMRETVKQQHRNQFEIISRGKIRDNLSIKINKDSSGL